MGRLGYFLGAVLGVGGIAWLLIVAAHFSGRETADRTLLMIAVPLVLIVGLGGLAALFSSGFRRPSPEPLSPTIADRVQAAIHIVVAVIVGVIASGLAFYFYRLEREAPVAPYVVAAADFLVTPFRMMLVLENNYYQVAFNWGIAALVYVIVGLILSRVVAALGGARKTGSSG